MNGDPKIRERYLEEIRLYMWHQPSSFTSFKGKHKSKELATKYLNLAHLSYEDYLRSAQQSQE